MNHIFLSCVFFKLQDEPLELGLYPEEVLGHKDTYPSPVLPKNLKTGDYIELQVAEVYNPHKFWITVREYALALDKLMDEMQ